LNVDSRFSGASFPGRYFRELGQEFFRVNFGLARFFPGCRILTSEASQSVSQFFVWNKN
jgi:hypothetical protein